MGWHEYRYGHMVNDYYVDLVRKVFEERQAARDRVRTRRDAEKLTAGVRQSFQQIFGPWPAKNPLKPRVTGRVETQHYTIEKVLFESRPSFLVSANLYLPRNLARPAPAVLGSCGHSHDGKAEAAYQAFVQGLVQKGFVVLIYDPIGQGERIQYPNAEGRSSLGLCAEHNLIGSKLSLLGDWFGAWRAWDGIRALDYLLSRPEVDRSRVGVTGNSGGGTLTGWLTALDPRFTMAAPGCWITSIRRNIENELPCDVEQIPPGFLAAGLDHADCFLAYAPRPLILLAQARDFFDNRGTREAYAQVRKIYRLLGAENNVRLFFGPEQHGYTVHLRQAMYGFFTRHAGLTPSSAEPPVTVRGEKELFATRHGSVLKAGSQPAGDFVAAEAGRLAKKRKTIQAKKLPTVLSDLLAIPKRRGAPAHRILRRSGMGAENWQAYALETEPGVQAFVTMVYNDGDHFAPPAEKSCTLIVPHVASATDLRDEGFRARLVDNGRIFAVDPRGIGQSTPKACDCGDFFHRYDCDYHYNSIGIMLQRPYQGGRVFDVLRTLDWLYASGYEKVQLVGRGLGSVTALFAATLEPRLAGITLVNGLLCYEDLVTKQVHKWPDSALVPGILKVLDLPDLARALGRRLGIIDPWDAGMQTVLQGKLAPYLKARRLAGIRYLASDWRRAPQK
ncbi:MAG: hypothetical protein C0404_04900 [Verrucomicrobia bacterium]|nr:hypothetical protein [Verrucomicrobiota bacterium]